MSIQCPYCPEKVPIANYLAHIRGHLGKASATGIERDVQKEMSEHPWATEDIARRIAEDHAKLTQAERPSIYELIDALLCSFKELSADVTEQRVALEEYVHALNRRQIVPNEIVDDLIKYGLAALEKAKTTEKAKMKGKAEVICSNCGKRVILEDYEYGEPCRFCGYKRTELVRWISITKR